MKRGSYKWIRVHHVVVYSLYAWENDRYGARVHEALMLKTSTYDVFQLAIYLTDEYLRVYGNPDPETIVDDIEKYILAMVKEIQIKKSI